MNTPPHVALRDFLIASLAGTSGLEDLAASGGIVAASDQREYAGLSAIVVECEDLGNHGGTTGRILVDVKCTVELRTHLTDDPGMSLFDSLFGILHNELAFVADNTLLDDWILRHAGNFTCGPVQMDSLYRYRACSFTAILQFTGHEEGGSDSFSGSDSSNSGSDSSNSGSDSSNSGSDSSNSGSDSGNETP